MTPTWARAVATCALTSATAARSPLWRPESFSDLLLRRTGRGEPAGKLVDVGLCALQIEAAACAGRDQLRVLFHTRPRQRERGVDRADLAGGLIQLLTELPFGRVSIGQLRLRFGKPLPVGPDLRLLRRQQRLERLDLVAIRGRVDFEKHVSSRACSPGLDHSSSHLRDDGHGDGFTTTTSLVVGGRCST